MVRGNRFWLRNYIPVRSWQDRESAWRSFVQVESQETDVFFLDTDISKKIGRLVTRQTILVLFIIFFSHLNYLGACVGFALANYDCIARKNNCLLSSIFQAGEGGFGQMMYRSPERSPQDSWDGFFFVQCPGARFSKVPLINGPGKLLPFTLKIEVSIVLHLTW